MDILSELIKISDTLDRAGLYSLANEIDEEIKEEFLSRKNNPKYNMIFDNIRKALYDASQNGNLPKDALTSVLAVIDSVQKNSFKYNTPIRDRYISEEQQGNVVPRKVFELAEGLAEAVKDRDDVKKELANTSFTDEDKIDKLNIALREDEDIIDRLMSFVIKLNNGNRPNDRVYYKYIMDYVYNQDKKLLPMENIITPKSMGE